MRRLVLLGILALGLLGTSVVAQPSVNRGDTVPIRDSQNHLFVKTVVGLPGDTAFVAGG